MSSETAPSQRRRTALAIIEAYNKWDIEAIMALRTDDCVQEIAPKSLGNPEKDNAGYRAWFGPMMAHFRGFTVTVDDLVEDSRANKVVLRAHSRAETVIGPYANEYVLILHMNEAGDKITRMVEFVDTNNSVTFFPKLREHMANKQASEGK